MQSRMSVLPDRISADVMARMGETSSASMTWVCATHNAMATGSCSLGKAMYLVRKSWTATR